jgi:1-acyl-sn-glycerol-3-phosphate acyltransferase
MIKELTVPQLMSSPDSPSTNYWNVRKGERKLHASHWEEVMRPRSARVVGPLSPPILARSAHGPRRRPRSPTLPLGRMKQVGASLTIGAPERDLWWKISSATLGTVAKTAFKLEVVGVGNIPVSGGALIAYNHISVIDALFVALPVVDRGRVVHFFALSQDFERPVLGWCLRKIGQIPIRRGFGDWEAIETSAMVLRRGMLAGVAPEGTVGDGWKVGPGQKGAARIALMAGAPVIPVGLWGTNLRWPKSGLKLSAPARPTVTVVFRRADRGRGRPEAAAGRPVAH